MPSSTTMAVAFSVWLLLVTFAWVLSIAVKKDIDAAERVDDERPCRDPELAALQALWALPTRTPASRTRP